MHTQTERLRRAIDISQKLHHMERRKMEMVKKATELSQELKSLVAGMSAEEYDEYIKRTT